MNLPLVLDIAIGLTFVYLILSLLASELQELFATIFQWRARHLKKSIEILLAGSKKDRKVEQHVRALANKLYDDPLIENLNQEARGLIEILPRRIIGLPAWVLTQVCFCIKRLICRTSFKPERPISFFGNNRYTGPSYIPGETFATTLLETSKIPTITRKLTELKLEEFKQDKLKDIEVILYRFKRESEIPVNSDYLEKFSKLDEEFFNLKKRFNNITKDFNNSKVDLNASIERMAYRLDSYIKTCSQILPVNENSKDSQFFFERLNTLKKDVFDNDKIRTVLLAWLKPSLAEIVEAIKAKESETYQDILKAYVQKLKAPVTLILEEIKEVILEEIKEVMLEEMKEKISQKPKSQSELNNITTNDIYYRQLNDAFEQLQQNFSNSIENFKNSKTSLTDSLEQMINSLKNIHIQPKTDLYKSFLEKYKDQTLAEVRLISNKALANIQNENIQNEIEKEIESRSECLEKELNNIIGNPKNINQDFVAFIGQIANKLADCIFGIPNQKIINVIIDEMGEKLDRYIKMIVEDSNKLHLSKNNINNFDEQITCLKQWKFPRILKIEEKEVEDEIEDIYEKYKKIAEVLNDKESEDYVQVIEAIDSLPKQVKDSFIVLARRAQGKVKSIDEELNQFKQEIEIWYDRSMERATGVYKRNAKGFTFLIGLVLAVLANADTFQLVNSLSLDRELRTVLTQLAIEQPKSLGGDKNPNKSVEQANEYLNKIFLPIGWRIHNLRHQMGCTVPSGMVEDQEWYFGELWGQPLNQVCAHLPPKQKGKTQVRYPYNPKVILNPIQPLKWIPHFFLYHYGNFARQTFS